MENNKQNYRYEMAAERVRKIRKFYTSIAIFVFIIAIVYGIKFFKYGFPNIGNLRLSWVFIIWGLILAIRGIKLFFFNSDWENDMINKEIKNKTMEIINNQDDIKYLEARKRVKRLKGFYSHFTIYILVNLLIVFINFQNLKPGESYFKLENFFTLFFWGIALLVHGMSIFLPQFVFGRNWEERKIRELMDKEK